MKKFSTLLFLIPLLLISGVGCSSQKSNIQSMDTFAATNQEIKSVETTDTIKTVETIIKNETIKDCDEDLSCFKEAAETCQLARVKNSYTVNNLGINLNFADYYEIKGQVGEKCLFYMKTNSLTTEYSADIKKLLLSQGMTKEQITEYEEAGNQEAKNNYNGKDGFCFFIYNDDLKSLINHWSNNDYSSLSIMDIAQCSGDLFNEHNNKQ